MDVGFFTGLTKFCFVFAYMAYRRVDRSLWKVNMKSNRSFAELRESSFWESRGCYHDNQEAQMLRFPQESHQSKPLLRVVASAIYSF
jgi:hypothetical protein